MGIGGHSAGRLPLTFLKAVAVSGGMQGVISPSLGARRGVWVVLAGQGPAPGLEPATPLPDAGIQVRVRAPALEELRVPPAARGCCAGSGRSYPGTRRSGPADTRTQCPEHRRR